MALLKYLFGFPGLFFPWLALYAGIAAGLWEILQATGSDLTRLSVGWIALLLACNEVIALSFYGAWHSVLYGRRFQGVRFKYNSSWPKEQSHLFLFGKPLASNIFWSLASAVPIWTAYLVLTLWAQATGVIRVTSWSVSPVYCSLLLFGLVFFHAVHFYMPIGSCIGSGCTMRSLSASRECKSRSVDRTCDASGRASILFFGRIAAVVHPGHTHTCPLFRHAGRPRAGGRALRFWQSRRRPAAPSPPTTTITICITSFSE